MTALSVKPSTSKVSTSPLEEQPYMNIEDESRALAHKTQIHCFAATELRQGNTLLAIHGILVGET